MNADLLPTANRPSVPAVRPPAAPPAAWAPISDESDQDRARVAQALKRSMSRETHRSYRCAWEYFCAWSSAVYGLTQVEMHLPVPAAVIAKFITDHYYGMSQDVKARLVRTLKARRGVDTFKSATIAHRVAVLSAIHRKLDVPDHLNPCLAQEIKELLWAIRMQEQQAGVRVSKKQPLTLELIGRIIKNCRADGLTGLRDAALFAFGFGSGGRRRSEISSAMFSDLQPIPGGYLYLIPKHKGNRTGRGDILCIAGRAAQILAAWVEAAAITDGFLFRRFAADQKTVTAHPLSGQAISLVVKKRIAEIGEDPKLYSAHSMRHGFVTSALDRGIPLKDIMGASLHKSRAVEGYAHASAKMASRAATLMDELEGEGAWGER